MTSETPVATPTLPAPPAAAAARVPGALRLRGPDALTFLQGQVTQDLRGLKPGDVALAGYQNPQGRVVALLRVTPVDGGLLAVLPSGLAGPVALRLSRYVLRAKVTIEDVSATQVLEAVTNTPFEALCARQGLARTDDAHAVLDGPRLLIDCGGGRALIVGPGARSATPDEALAERWAEGAIACGVAEVYPETSEAFTAHMLNLDLLGAVSFKKGCYTGQEIVARTEHLGRVKRRLQCYTAAPGAPLPGPLEPLYAGADKVGEVALAVRGARGLQCLAVVALQALGGHLASAEGCLLTPCPLPYEVPA